MTLSKPQALLGALVLLATANTAAAQDHVLREFPLARIPDGRAAGVSSDQPSWVVPPSSHTRVAAA